MRTQSVTERLYAMAAEARIPLGGAFELSPVCNFACKMCYVRKTQAQIREEGKRLRTVREWLDLAEQCKNAGMLYLLLTGGEPFLYPGFRELYERLHKMGMVLSINTNGTLIDEYTVSWLKANAPSRLNITLYGASPETYGRICGNPEGYERAMHSIRMLHDARIPLVINASMIPENAEDMEKIIKIGQELGINTRVATYMFPPARREREAGDSRFTPEESARLALRRLRCSMPEEVYRQYLESHQGDGREPAPEDWGGSLNPEFMRCRAGRSSFWVSWDGTMTACGITRFPLVCQPFEEDFLRCWRRLNETVCKAQVLSGCSGCPKRELCNPCVAMAVTETGDPNQKIPYLCSAADHLRRNICTELERLKQES